MRKNYILLRTWIVLVVMSATAVMTANAQSKVTKALKADVIDWGNQVYKEGVTNSAGQGVGITAELGYSTTNTNPATWTNWISATYNVDAGNNDEYMANLGTAVGVGTYYYAYRYKLNSGDFYYAGTGGAWNNDNGELTVNRAKPFITKWYTKNPPSTISGKPESSYTQIYFPGIGTNYTIEWEDVHDATHTGTLTNVTSTVGNPVLIDFGSVSEYIVKVYPQGFESIQFATPALFGSNSSGDQEKLTEIQQWGDIVWKSIAHSFCGCKEMQLIATDAPNLSNITNMDRMFRECSSFNADINSWDVSKVTNMTDMFYGCDAFNQPLNSWDVSSVTDMADMFYGCDAFNQPLNSWDVSSVTDMAGMFSNCSAFNQDLGSWNLKSVVHHDNYMTSSLENMFSYSGMDCANYGNTLIGWANNPETPDNLTLGAKGLKYGTNGKAARTTLIGKGWTIERDTYDAGCTESTGIETISNSGHTLSIYPNPAQEQVIVEVSDNAVGRQLTIVDVSGKVVYTQPITATTITVTLHRFQQGIYFVKADNVTSKLVIK